ncbi:MAG TPA: hypothetical protein VN969_06800 [Streptosporangiaceae bacterium]|nr:hypothetical protein [Streptosporangiaceae bacterium]
MLSSGIIDLAIGLTFVFGVTAALASAVTELIARFIGLRGAYLLSGLRELVDGGGASTVLGQAGQDYQFVQGMISRGLVPLAEPAPAELSPAEVPGVPAPPIKPVSVSTLSATGALLGGPILRSQGMAGQISSRKLTLAATGTTGRLPKMTSEKAGTLWSQRRSLPSYIPARSFAEAVIDLVVPGASGQATMTDIQRGVNALPQELSAFKPSLQALAKNAGEDAGKFRTSVEQWYDDHMDRVSGWYKRYAAKITFAVGLILVVLLNINALTIGRTLYNQSAVSTAISAVAAKGTSCPATEGQQECLANLQAQISAAATAGLPIGWGTVRDCAEPGARCGWLDQRGIFSRHGNSGWQLALVLAGFLIMIIALIPGAQFWFGLLSKLGTLRSSGPKPAPAGS